MKYTNKLIALGNKLEQKLSKYAQQPIVEQSGTTELFFGDEGKQRAFNQAISGQGGTLGKFIIGYATKTQKTASFDLKANAEPNKGASWVLQVVPPALKDQVWKMLDAEFQKMVGGNMNAKAKEADAKAKAGGGSGTLDIGSFSADMD